MAPLRLSVVFAFVALVVGCGGDGGDEATVARWISRGPPGADVDALAVDPTDPDVVYAGTGHGIFKTTDGGDSWVPVSRGLGNRDVQAIAIHPQLHSVLYAGTAFGGRVFKSTNGGRTWRASDVGLAGAPGNAQISALVIDPATPTTVYAASFRGGVFKSVDRGRSWKAMNRGLEKGVVALAIDPRDTATLFAVAEPDVDAGGRGLYGILKTVDGGRSWTAVHRVHANIFEIAVDPRTPRTVHAVGSGHFKSVDGGDTWTMTAAGHFRASLAIDPESSETLYAGTTHGVLRSTDGGETWEEVATIHESWVGCDAVAVAPGVVYASWTDRGVLRSTDGGDTWEEASWGLVGRAVISLAVDARDVVYAGTRDRAFVSTDGGTSWRSFSRGLADGEWLHSLALDRAGRTLYAATGQGVFRTATRADSWRKTWDDEQAHIVWSLAVEPDTAATVYAGVGVSWSLPPPGHRGVFKSTDGGRTWDRMSRGLDAPFVRALAIAPTALATVYAGGHQYFDESETGPPGEEVGGGVFKTTDGGETWTPAGLGNRTVLSLAVDPSSSALVYAGTGDGLFTTADGGVLWTAVEEVGGGVSAVVIDPARSETVYAGSLLGVFRTTDGGESWQRLGLRDLEVHALAIDSDGRMLYAGTDSGVWAYPLPR